MEEQMEWNRICENFPNEWVVVVDYENRGPVEVRGTVMAHGSRKSDLRGLVSKAIQKHGQAAVRFTGEIVQESDLPL